MKKIVRLLPILALILSACDNVSERECGVFDHPDLSVWESTLGATTVQFMNDEGTTIDFTRNAVTFNEPFVGSDGSSNDEDVVCQLSATIRYESNDNNLAISSVYVQSERTLLESADEILAADHVIEAPANEILNGSFLADISVDSDVIETDDDSVFSTRIIFSASRVMYLETEADFEVVGGISYQDVVRVNAPDILFVEETNEEGETETVIVDSRVPSTDSATEAGSEPVIGLASDTVRQVVIGRQAGLIAFTDGEGREFVRIAQ